MSSRSRQPNVPKGDTVQGSSPSVSASTKRQLLPRIWPPPTGQAYCVDHFLDECEAYHRSERARFEELRTAIINNYRATRQSTGVSTSSRPRTGDAATDKAAEGALDEERVSAAAEAEIAKLREQRKMLGLHRSLRTFIGHIGEMIRHCSHELGLDKAQADIGSRLHDAHKDKCPFLPRRGKSLICRYCDFEDRTPRPVAPIAPMDRIPKSSFMKKQCKSIYGIVFVVDICSRQVVVTLYKMAWLDNLYSLLKAGETTKDDGEGLERRQSAETSSEKSIAKSRTRQDSKNAPTESHTRQGDGSGGGDKVAVRKRKATKPPQKDEISVMHKHPHKQKRSAMSSSRQNTLGNERWTPTIGRTRMIRKYNDDDDVIVRKRRKTPSRTG